MSAQYLNFFVIDQTRWDGAEDLTGYEGRIMRAVSSTTCGPCSVTNQATTKATYPIGVLYQGSETDVVGGPRIVVAGIVDCVAGTGGVTVGARIVPEYAASGLDRGRGIAIAPSDITDTTYITGMALTAASEDGVFRLQLIRQPVAAPPNA